MKKLLMLLGSISIIVGSVSTVIACDNPRFNQDSINVQSMFENAIKTEFDRANEVTTQLIAEQYKIDFNDNKIKVKDVIIELNYIPPTHDQPGSFHVVFAPTVAGKYNQAKEIKSSNNVIVYDVQVAFEAAIAEELNYANEIKTRSAADNYKAPKIEGVDITNDYIAPLPNATSKFQAAFNPKETEIYRDAAPRSSNANIINYEDPAIQAEFEKEIADEKKHANEIKTHKQAEEYKNNFDPTKIQDVKIELKYTAPTLKTWGSFYVIFHPTPFGNYKGASSTPSNRNTFKYDHQIFFEKAIESEWKRAEQVRKRKDAHNYTPPVIEGVDILKEYVEPTIQTPSSFQVIFTPTANGIYKGAKSLNTKKVIIKYEAIDIKEYWNAIGPMTIKFQSVESKNDICNLWTHFGGKESDCPPPPDNPYKPKVITNTEEIRGVKIIYTVTNWYDWNIEIKIEFNPIENNIYSDVGKYEILKKSLLFT
ncbi:lipoprotein [Williamsoniiplasma luminosum]|uniref:Lipoprotein n=1 Tax=Williamsoniiplasma luminosum TaxID=214888 RepID=A0A2S0NJK2_9MOLU|nr:lipoprotein [Williamsoniiplasma luminosum]AVP49189.1 MAG: hypothetical protein C5T88_01145 [Williamsoniiplasma luminosum]